jgi:putative heme-binding domain-containing protein
MREWTIRFLGNDGRLTRALADMLEELAFAETSPTVRLQLAASCRRWPVGMMLPILAKLSERDADTKDPMIPLTLWWSSQHHFAQNPETIMEWVQGSSVMNRPMIAQAILPRLARMLVAQASADAWKRLESLYGKSDPKLKKTIETELEQGASVSAAAGLSSGWKSILAESCTSGATDSALFRASLKFGQPQAIDRAREIVNDSASPLAMRRQMLAGIVAANASVAGPLIARLIEDARTPDALVSDALGAAGAVNDNALADAILTRYGSLAPALQAQAVTSLTKRPAWAMRLLTAVGSGKIEKSKLSAAGAQAIDRLGDEDVSQLLEKVWGRPLRPTSESRIRRVAEIRGILPEGDKGVASRGRAVFLKTCANCHQFFGDGSALGPELNGADRGNLDFLLTSLVDPSAQIRSEYQAVQVALKDGRVLHGLLADKNAAGMSLIDAERKTTKIADEEIEEAKASDVSLMPEGLLDTLKDDEIRDLFRYLQSAGPPPR